MEFFQTYVLGITLAAVVGFVISAPRFIELFGMWELLKMIGTIGGCFILLIILSFWEVRRKEKVSEKRSFSDVEGL